MSDSDSNELDIVINGLTECNAHDAKPTAPWAA